MHHRHIRLGATLCLVFLSETLGYRWPSPQYDALEGLLYEGRRADGLNIADIMHPCLKRPGIGSLVAAEWLRIAFHDMATHNIEDGTGGLDASILHELYRAENLSLGFNHTMSDFEAFPNKYISHSDIIAIGAVMAVASCGGPIIPYRGGRVDAFTAGLPGTPEAHQDIQTHTDMFRRQGFTQSEMIELTACGHTMGGVRSSDFPALVPASSNGEPNFENFDTTDQFDNAVITEYLDGTTKNPLVVTANKTMVSDLRVFQSDGNQTMHSLSPPDAFASRCGIMFERMINTVPAHVALTEEITLLPAKALGVQLTIDRNQLVFKATLRLTQALNATANANRTVKIYWCDRYGSAKNCSGTSNYAPFAKKVQDAPKISPITQNLGYSFINYNFVVPVNPGASIAKFWFEVDEQDGSAVVTYNNEGDGYQVAQDQVLFVNTLSTATQGEPTGNSSEDSSLRRRGGFSDNTAFTKHYTFVAAVRNTTTPSRVYADAFDLAIRGALPPFNTTLDFKLNSTLAPVAGYNFYIAELEEAGLQLTLDLHGIVDGTTYTEDFLQTSFLDNTPYIAPSTVETAKSSTSAAKGMGDLRVAGHLICALAILGSLFSVLS